MRAKSLLPILSGAAIRGGALLVTLYTQRSAVSQTVAADDSELSFRMRFGVTDAEPKAWDGTLTVSGGGEALRCRQPKTASARSVSSNAMSRTSRLCSRCLNVEPNALRASAGVAPLLDRFLDVRFQFFVDLAGQTIAAKYICEA